MKTTTKTPPIKEAIRLTKLWQDHGPNTYPLDLDKLIEGAIHTSGFEGQLRTKSEDLESIEGCLVRTKGTQNWTILLNENIANARRRRFTQAHELGHFMCHRGLKDRFEDSDATLNDFNDELETEANIFASWLLMPANIMRAEFYDMSWETASLKSLGSRFECSLQASALRFVKASKQRPIAFIVSRDGMIIWACKSESAPYLSSFVFGDELPEHSRARASFEQKCYEETVQESGLAWNSVRSSQESQYFDSSGNGYQYTCVSFEGP